MRLAPVDLMGPRLLNFDNSDSEQRMAVGTPLTAAATDFSTTANVGNWGTCELVYTRYASSTVINPGRILALDKNFTILDNPNTANTGRRVYVALSRFTAGDVNVQYGWVLRSGICPVQYGTAATVGPVYFAAAGTATPTLQAGKQILNANCLIAAVSTFTKTVQTRNGSSQVGMPNMAGVYVGQAISGTGIPASSVVSSIDPGGRFVVIGSAIGTPVTATASGSVTGTFTNTGYGIVEIDRGFVQGNIT